MYGFSSVGQFFQRSRVHRDAVVVLHQLDVRQVRQPDLHRRPEQFLQLGNVLRIGRCRPRPPACRIRGFFQWLKFTGMRAGHRDALALIQAHRVIRLADAAAMAVDRADELALLEPAVEIGRQAQARRHAVPLQHLRQAPAPWRGPDAPKPMISSVNGLPSGSSHMPPCFLNPFALQQRVALLRIELQRVVFRQQILHRIEIGQQRLVRRHRQGRTPSRHRDTPTSISCWRSM